MAKYIDKTAVKAEIKRLAEVGRNNASGFDEYRKEKEVWLQQADVCDRILSFLDTLEVKDLEEKFEHPNIEAKDSVEVSSRMPHIDKSLLPIAEFIMEYCSWNLHKDEWNQPVLEVPLFRVLDALVQKGKPYCEG